MGRYGWTSRPALLLTVTDVPSLMCRSRVPASVSCIRPGQHHRVVAVTARLMWPQKAGAARANGQPFACAPGNAGREMQLARAGDLSRSAKVASGVNPDLHG
jgi:hypothetical protein